jgi:CheY-like chemotaxis protein
LYALLTVTDTGPGLDAEVQAHLFEPFFSSRQDGRGSGMGLSMAYGIVRQDRGHLTVDSAPGRGTTFKIYLPQAGLSASEAPPRTPAMLTARGGETILIAEDEDMIRSLVRRTLEPMGYRVLEADSAEKALEVHRQHAAPIHLLLTDAVLPKMRGSELAGVLVPARPGLKVLYISGYPAETIVRHGVLRPDTPFLQKPFAPRSLAAKVREVLGQAGG